MNIKPQGTKLIVKPLEKKEEVQDSGIIIPGVANADLREGLVISVGEQLEGFIKKDDIVLYPDKKGCQQLIDGVWYLWLDAEAGREEVWGLIQK